MFCRLFEFKEHTGIEVISFESCNKECAHYAPGNKCLICSDKEVNLYNKERFNWNITRTIDFSFNELSNEEDTFTGAIKLIHPSYQSIWIMRWTSLKKDGSTTDTFSIFIKSELPIEDINRLNWFLRKNCNYEGRNININDFVIKKEIVDDSNKTSDI